MSEQWRPVVGYEGFYEVSDHGRVRSVPRGVWKRSRWGSMAWYEVPVRQLRLTPLDGYRVVGLRRNDATGQRQKKVHRLVLEAFVGPCPDGMEACHWNGDRADNRIVNLRWDTPSSNSYDRVRHGTHSKTRITHCPRGHRLAAPNLDPSQTMANRRSCWACRLAQDDGRVARRKDEPFDLASRAAMYWRALQDGWRPEPNATKERCSRGHPLVAPNLRRDQPTGARGGCKACRSATGYIGGRKRRGHPTSHLDVAVLADEYYARIMGGAA